MKILLIFLVFLTGKLFTEKSAHTIEVQTSLICLEILAVSIEF